MLFLARLLPASTYRLLPALLLWTLFAAANAQEEEVTPASADDAAETPAESPDAAETDDESDLGPDDPLLDAQGFDPNDDDDFVPSEDIPADAPIAFPTDI